MDQEAADSEADLAAAEQVAQEVEASAVDMPEDQEEVWVQGQEVPCITDLIMDLIGTVHVGTDQDLFLSLEDQDITARVAVTDPAVKTMAVA